MFFKIPPMVWLYEWAAVNTRRVHAFLKPWFKTSKLMDSAWGEENQKSGRTLRFASSKHFCSGQFVHNYSISRPNCLVCFVHPALHRASVRQAAGFTAGELPQAGAASGHVRGCRESSAGHPPRPVTACSWALIPCTKGKQNTNEYLPCVFQPERFDRRHRFILQGVSWGVLLQPKKSLFFESWLCGTLVPQGSSSV